MTKDLSLRRKNRMIFLGLIVFSLALCALVIILMLLRGPAKII